MKKTALLFTLILSAALFTACGSKQTENVQTEAASSNAQAGPASDAIQESRPAVSVAELPDEYEPQYFEGTVTAIDGVVITVSGDSSSMSFDVSRNETSDENPVLRGCYVEVSYADSPADSIYPADNVSILNDNEERAEQEDRDPVIYGTLQYLDANELVLIDDAGRSIDFDPIIARTVSFSELKGGEDVVITYCGSVYGNDDEDSSGAFNGLPVAIKIVSSDAVKSEEAEANYIDGVVSAVDSASMTVATEIADFEFECDDSMLKDIESDDAVRVFYSGQLSGITVKAEKIEKR